MSRIAKLRRALAEMQQAQHLMFEIRTGISPTDRRRALED